MHTCSTYFCDFSISEICFRIKSQDFIANGLPFLSRQSLKSYHLLTLLGVIFFQGETAQTYPRILLT
nr:MAG TPA: hypothetical protein [Caudoviricetes sp.]